MNFYIEIELRASGQLDDDRFDALAETLYDLDEVEPSIGNMTLGASLAEGRADVSMTVEAADPAAAATKALSSVRAAIHAIGDATPGWETARSVIRVAPAEESERLSASA